MWFHVTDDPAEAESIYTDRLLPIINRPEEVVRDRLPVGTPDRVAEKLLEFKDAGVQRIFLWPVVDEVTQILRFAEQVEPAIRSA